MSNSSYSESEESRDQLWLTEQLKHCTNVNKHQKHCNVCNRTINKWQINEHLEGGQHEHQLNIFLRTHKMTSIDTDFSFIYHCELCNSYTDNLMLHIKSNVDHVNWTWIYGGVNKDRLKYYVYDVPVQNAEATNFRARYDSMLIYNYIRKLNDTHFFCDVCHLNLAFKTEINHMFVQGHISSLRDFQRQRKL